MIKCDFGKQTAITGHADENNIRGGAPVALAA